MKAPDPEAQPGWSLQKFAEKYEPDGELAQGAFLQGYLVDIEEAGEEETTASSSQIGKVVKKHWFRPMR